MAVRVLPAMSPGLSASIAEVAAMFDSTFCKRFRSSYESLPYQPHRQTSFSTFELVKDDKEESEDAEGEGPTAEDGDPAAGDEGLAAGDEGHSMR
ncbi:hypothetical protein Tco_1025106, partial [Tanacetum coccineum]